jgi:hypothetical protein
VAWGHLPFSLLARQDQQLGICGKHLTDRILKLTARSHLLLDFLDPILGDALARSFPPTMKASDQAAWPLPLAQWQDGFPQRV